MDVPKWRLLIARRSRPHVSLLLAVLYLKKKNEMAMQGFDYWPLDYGTVQIF